jgi:hypothetical protein
MIGYYSVFGYWGLFAVFFNIGLILQAFWWGISDFGWNFLPQY